MSSTPITTCSGTFYDPGGTGNYANSLSVTQTFTPATPGAKLIFNFTSFLTEEGYDYLYVYNGPSTASPLIGVYDDFTGPGTVTATNATGQLTFRFTSDGSVTETGWVATISCSVTAPPAIASFTPVSGPPGTSVNITGTGFTGLTTVSFNGSSAFFVVNSSTSLTAQVPAGATTGPISATNAAGTATSATSFTVLPAPPSTVPFITSITPASAPVGSTVTISGANFSTTPADNIVRFGAVRAVVNAATATQLTVTVPAGASYGPISVTTAGPGLTAYSAANFSVIFGGGSLTASNFAPKVDFTTGNLPWDVNLADFDNDGKTDVVVTNTGTGFGGNTVTVYRNNSTPGSITTASMPLAATLTGTNAPIYIDAGDLDGDGRQDVVVAYNNVGTLGIYRNTSTSGNISFAPQQLVTSVTTTFVGNVLIHDLDMDGKPEIVLANFSGNNVIILRNVSSVGLPLFAPPVTLTAGTNPQGLAIGDLNGDNKPEIVVTNRNSDNVTVYPNNTLPGSLTAASFGPSQQLFAGDGPTSAQVGDLDGDGKLDIAVANLLGNTVSVYRNTSVGGSLSFQTAVSLAMADNPFTIALADMDGDNKVDIVSKDAHILRNVSTPGTLTAASFTAANFLTPSLTPYHVAIGDMDGEGRPDLVITNNGSNTFSIIRSFTPCAAPTATISATCSGSTTTVTATLSGPTPWTLTYSVNGVPQTVTTSTSPYVLSNNAAANTVYALISVVSNSCTGSAIGSVTVQPFPTAPVSISTAGCPGPFTFTATGGGPSATYAWYTTATGGTPVGSGSSFTTPALTATTTYYVAATNAQGCQGPRTPVTATVSPAPTVTTGPAQTLCTNASPLQLSGFAPAGGTWSGPGVTAGGLFTPTPSLTGTQTLTYSVNQGGCTGFSFQNITVNPVPVVTAGASQNVCSNDAPVVLTGFSPVGGTWTGTGVSAGGVFTPDPSLLGSHTLTYSFTQGGCTGTGTRTITVIASPNVTAGPNETTCSGAAPFQLNAFSPAGGTWSGTGVSATGLFSPAAAGVGVFTVTYSITVGGCTGTSTKQVTVFAAPATPTVNVLTNDTLESSVAGLTYEWRLNGNVMSQTTRKIKATTSGSYTVRVLASGNCISVLSLPVSYTVVGLPEQFVTGIRLFPNPSTGYVQLHVPALEQRLQVEVVNALGQEVLTRSLSPGSQLIVLELELGSMAKGLYLVQLRTASGLVTKKLVLE